MYRVTLYDGPQDTDGVVIHSENVDGLKVQFDINQVLEGVSDMSFTINAANPAWNLVKPLVTLIKVLNTRTQKLEFDGRVLKPVQTMSQEGMFYTKYSCESKLAYLNDSRQRYAKIQNTTIADFLTYLIGVHNAQVEPHKRFLVGNVTVTNSTDNVYRYVGYENSYAEIKDNLLDRLGGFLVLRDEEDGTYLDYLAEVGEVKETAIELRRNLKDMQREIDPTEVITRIIPLGAREEAPEGETPDASMPRLDIKTVNNGLDYLDDLALQEEFGIIEGTIIYDDINTPSTLKLRGQQFFAQQAIAIISYDVTQLDLSLIDASFDSFEVGNHHPIKNPLFNVEETLQIIGKKITSSGVHLDKLTIGSKRLTLSQYQVEANKSARKVVELQGDLERQRATIQALKDNVQQSITDVQNIITTINTEEIPDLQNAINSLNQAVDNLADIVDTLPEYGLATTTQAGLMSAPDKVKLDGLENYTLATTTDDGLMSKEDKSKLNLISVTGVVDLDDLLSRLEALENG